MTLTVNDVCARLRVNIDNVLAWIHAGELVATNVASKTGPGRRATYRIEEEDLEAFIAARQTIKATPTVRRRQKARRPLPANYTRYF